MKRLFFIVLALLLLIGIGIIAWIAAGQPPVRMVWRYGFSYGPEPTGRTLTVEGLDFVEVGRGCFLMGSHYHCEEGDLLGQVSSSVGLPFGRAPDHKHELPVQWTEIRRPFWIARCEVTNRQFESFLPGFERSTISTGDPQPVAGLSWEEATAFCDWLAGRSGFLLRLPSEAEWECSCRAGSQAEFCFGDEETRLKEWAWHRGTTGDRITRAVGSRRFNSWGLYDLHGNVWEWCDGRDSGAIWGGYSGGPRSEFEFEGRVIRGGGIAATAPECRSASRVVVPDPVDTVIRGKLLPKATGFRPALNTPVRTR